MLALEPVRGRLEGAGGAACRPPTSQYRLYGLAVAAVFGSALSAP